MARFGLWYLAWEFLIWFYGLQAWTNGGQGVTEYPLLWFEIEVLESNVGMLVS